MKIKQIIEVVDFLVSFGVKARAYGDRVAINRDSICSHPLFVADGLPEETVYPAVRLWVQDHLSGTFYWAGKTDDELFLDTINE